MVKDLLQEHQSKDAAMKNYTNYMRRHGCKFIDVADDFKKLSSRYEECKRRVESERGGEARPKRPRVTSQQTLGAKNLIHLSEGGGDTSVGGADKEWQKIVKDAFLEVYGTKKRSTKSS